jgi:hypothetical protein
MSSRRREPSNRRRVDFSANYRRGLGALLTARRPGTASSAALKALRHPNRRPTASRRAANSRGLIVGLDWTFDNLGFLSKEARHMSSYVVRSYPHRFLGAGFVVKDAEGGALTLASIQPVVAHKTRRLLTSGTNPSRIRRSTSALSFGLNW